MVHILLTELKQIKKEIEEEIQHSYLEKYVKNPVIDEDKLFLLTSIIDNTSFANSTKRQYIITTMLVQIALDTHDLVVSKKEEEPVLTTKTRQLTVLAGDYYSGLYYHLLSRMDDIPMISALASAIKEINEYKMNLYHRNTGSFQEYLDDLMQIESLLIQRVAEFLQRPSIKDVAGEWLLTRKLIQEKNCFQNKGNSPVFEHLFKRIRPSSTYKQMMVMIESLIESKISKLEVTISNLPIHFHMFKSYVQSVMYENLTTNSKVAEEG
ncbi:heptaprenyl diphosphate synthase component 1 [Aquibacillus sp. 3ASR75-11]|uniref:Heptaprenyl diphosphate synthase component 1 n=1 Tax=Terrihalobacillus insolitus TaxID=2950438 RepID=A0A9X3WRN6_9BACI|nr:heptaprenyl diphosphate synthase component 1 [Terrihalobacillus insolitus]MDC3424797.1 heptaprenyl diphosphate synthase component 1 [Terrihalobacillus insolitus]